MPENQNSILDKIISSRNLSEIDEFNPDEVIVAFLKPLPNKEGDILRRRFGLGGQLKETLETIGRLYRVTRERIRQIEKSAIHKIKHSKEFKIFVPRIEHLLTGLLKQRGGVMNEELLLRELFPYAANLSAYQPSMSFLLEEILSTKFLRIDVSRTFKKSWYLHELSLPTIKETIDQIVQCIERANRPRTLSEFLELLEKDERFQLKEPLSNEALISYIHISQKIEKNPFGEYGLTVWGSIKPKRINDKIYLVLKKAEKPLHFREICQRINEIRFDERKAYPPTVHNELIINNHYVLVGRGIYALKEWGYQEGVVTDVIVDILKKAGKPLSREEIIEKVLKQRIVKKNTIHLALMDQSKFVRLPNQLYTLVDHEPLL